MHRNLMIASLLALGGMNLLAANPDKKYESFPVPAGDFRELTMTENGTKFSLWSPEAESVEVRIYRNENAADPMETISLTKGEAGVWSTIVPSDLKGKYYAFRVKHDGKWLAETPGIWVKAAGTNGLRGAIIDPGNTNPDGWERDKGPQLKAINDAVIYEMHHRDFSVHPSSGITSKGKFLALTEQDTHSPTGEKTGIEHLKELGVTHVHILPSYDYNSVDEGNLNMNQYNWGYDPFNYNLPEGSYSTNPADPEARIREMKEMVKSLHDAGIGVVMDVVYNHTANNDDSNFSLTAPGYFYRHKEDGSYSDASGCGNETASEREMMRNYIVNSVKYWAKEFHIDGFRFDLMAIHDIETMNRLTKELKEINPDIFVYGEGWTAGDSPLPAEKRALKENVAKMPDVAVFSDDLREAVKGHYSDAARRGFVSGAPGNEETIKIGVVASTAHPQVDYSKGNNSKFAYAAAPTQIINYVSCHDDLTLTDKLRKSMPEANEEQLQRAAKLAQTIVFTSQGTPFMFAGEEVFRDKKGVHNSYKSPDDINAIDWNLKHENRELFDYYRNLIQLRKEHPAFRMKSAEEVAKNIRFDKMAKENLVSYSILNNANGDAWKEIKVIYNGNPENVDVKIPAGNWKVIAEDGKIDASGLRDAKGGKMTVAPISALILAKEK